MKSQLEWFRINFIESLQLSTIIHSLFSFYKFFGLIAKQIKLFTWQVNHCLKPSERKLIISFVVNQLVFAKLNAIRFLAVTSLHFYFGDGAFILRWFVITSERTFTSLVSSWTILIFINKLNSLNCFIIYHDILLTLYYVD